MFLSAGWAVILHGYGVTSSEESLKQGHGRFYFRRRRRLWEQTKVFICVSEFIKQNAINPGFPEPKLRVHYIGLLAPERDHKLLAEHISRYLLDETFWRACSGAGPEWIRQRFDLQQETHELETIYKDAMSSRPESVPVIGSPAGHEEADSHRRPQAKPGSFIIVVVGQYWLPRKTSTSI